MRVILSFSNPKFKSRSTYVHSAYRVRHFSKYLTNINSFNSNPRGKYSLPNLYTRKVLHIELK